MWLFEGWRRQHSYAAQARQEQKGNRRHETRGFSFFLQAPSVRGTVHTKRRRKETIGGVRLQKRRKLLQIVEIHRLFLLQGKGIGTAPPAAAMPRMKWVKKAEYFYIWFQNTKNRTQISICLEGKFQRKKHQGIIPVISTVIFARQLQLRPRF